MDWQIWNCVFSIDYVADLDFTTSMMTSHNFGTEFQLYEYMYPESIPVSI